MTAALRSAIDYTTLGWVKPELDETLRQARAEIESFAEDPADSEHMRQCAEHMHQVQGTLRMLELYAPAMVAEEMERLAQALQNGEVTDRDAGSTALMRGALLLPDYLERLQSGHRDIPIVLLPLLNELRAARGETGLSETVLFASEPTQAPSEIEIGHAEGSLRGRNRTLLETVAAAVKEELLRVKDVLDLHVRSHGDDVSGLKAQAETLDRVADTLGMLGLGVARGIVQQQRDTVHAIANGQQPADEGTLLDVAGALLYVDATLDEQVARLSDSDVDISQQGRIGNESRKVVETVSREAAVNFADARQAFVAFVETGWDHHQLSEVPRLLTEVAGAMTMLDLPQPAAYLDGMRLYTETELLGRKRIPNGRQLDTVADTLTSLEYYAEALRENRSNRDEILDVAQNSLEALGYWPIPDVIPEIQPIVVSVPEVAEEPVAEVVEVEAAEGEAVSATFVEAPADVEKTSVAAIHEAAAEAPALVPVEIPAAAIPAVSATTSGFEDAGDDIDDEIREVFLEEFAEETTNLETLLPAWREQPEDLDRLRPIRRVFHTLKGSGRLVGARTLGEFSWKIESLLNRVLDGARSPTPAVVAVVDRAFETLPQLHTALRGDGPITADLASLQALADRVAEGEEVLAPAVVAPALAPATVEVATAAAAASLAEEEPQVPDEPAPPIPAPPPVVEQKRVPASVDALLLEILDAEVAGHLVTVDAWLAQARSAPTPASDALLRAVHTMNGAFAMAEVPVINEALGPAEAWVRRMLAAKQDASGEGVEAMTELAALIRATVTGLHASSPHVPTCDAVATRLAALRDSLPEVTTSTIGTFASFEDEVEIVQLDDSESLLNGGPASAVTVDETAVATAAAEAILLDEVRRQEESRLEAERLEAERLEAERLEAERLEAERLEAERLEAERLEAERLEAERLEAERLEAERLEAERLEAERLEAERLEAERLEAERLEAERLEAERLEAERLEAERLEAARAEAARIAEEEAKQSARLEDEHAEAERIAHEQALAEEREKAARLEAERLEIERRELQHLESSLLEAERIEAERFEAARFAAEQLEVSQLEAARAEAARIAEEEAKESARLEAERAEAERLEAERLEAERLEAERLEAERLEAERLEAERLEAERLEAERLEAERLEAERLEAERLEAERLEAERLEAERLEAERLEAERLEAERLEAERLEAERLEAERLEAERLGAELAQASLVAVEAEPLQDEDQEAEDIVLEAPPEPEASVASDQDDLLDFTDLDAELVDLFVEEAGDLLDHADGLLAQLREAPGEREPVIGLQRDLHTLKGSARMAGIMAVGDLGHAMESLLEAVAEQQVELGRGGVPLLERGFDRLHAMITRIGAHRTIEAEDALIAEFNARALGHVAEESTEVASDPQTRLKPLSAPIRDGAEDEGVTTRAPQEQVRIRADLLDRLVNYAGEVAIYRARLEQQLGAFRGAMGEMAQTNTRLRDQLRRLDIETEAQIIARYQREHEVADQTFDPLELDRFSTLQQLSRALSESAADMSSLQGTLDDLIRQYETLLLQQSRVSSELQEGLMRTRMVPFDALVPRLRRVLRQAASETGKHVQLKLDGTQGELDRNVLERMTAPLEHMLRNAVAHGLETPALRRDAGKPEEGTVRIAMRREGSEVVLEIGDDGRGLDREAIRRRGEERGLIRADAVLSDGDLNVLILESGFSTADEVSHLAGRGVGMDVVASEVRQLGGALDIASRNGEGTSFTLRLPQTLAVTQAVFVKIGETNFAVPIASVRGVGRISRDAFEQSGASYRYGDEDYHVHDLGQLIGQPPARAEGQLQMPLLLIRSGELRAAIAVDQIVGNREIVVKPVGPQVASIPGIFGATIMGDGGVVVILDIAPLVRRQAVQPRDTKPAAPAAVSHRVPLVMVVDDSVTMRKVTGRILERHNFEVMVARDGIDALEHMVERVPDLMLLDIEMPRMDGYELAIQMKSEPRLRDVPIVMITSRTGEKHRQRAIEIGVERYLGKPYQENELVRNVYELLKLQRHDNE